MLIRKLHAHEKLLFAEHLKRLPPDDRQFRFAHAKVADEIIDRYVASISPDDLILGAFTDDRLAGGAHVAFADDIAEVGVSVDPDVRTQGIGADLFRRAIAWARNRRAAKLYTLCQADNRAMLALAAKLGMVVHRESGTAEACLALPPPDLLTVSDELSAGMHTVMADWADLMRTCRGVWLPRSG
ncbi:MAG TPA: GNAT family N-acetyltransferase [Magnetospirillum sp.]|jgi:RimJ/RimL family protein N-acetyltransferase|nr:GNAT family N-acetyltransferase [Magnetospirillum sp.]